jgi:hypothetical protein
MTVTIFLDLIARIEKQFGPLIAAAVARIFRQRTTITYTPEQTESFVENEIKAMEYRADDLARSEA